MLCRQAWWLWMLSTETPISLTPRLPKSSLRLANSASSVEQTGVKSAGWAKSMTQLPACHDENVSSPLVDIAVKSGAGSPIRGIVVAGAAAAAAGFMSPTQDIVSLRFMLSKPRSIHPGSGEYNASDDHAP